MHTVLRPQFMSTKYSLKIQELLILLIGHMEYIYYSRWASDILITPQKQQRGTTQHKQNLESLTAAPGGPSLPAGPSGPVKPYRTGHVHDQEPMLRRA